LSLLGFRARRNVGQDATLKRFEGALVAEEARDGDVGQSVEHCPLFGMGVEPFAIGGKPFDPELIHPPPQALAHLAMDLAEALPA
jgi:hypothetical protein